MGIRPVRSLPPQTIEQLLTALPIVMRKHDTTIGTSRRYWLDRVHEIHQQLRSLGHKF